MSQRVAKRLLLVDDNEDLRAAAAEFLVEQGYNVQTAASGEAALELWNDRGATIDLVITDFMLPGIDGVELLSRIAATDTSAPALVISSYLDDESMRRQVAAGNLYFLAKPFAVHQLADKVAEALQGQPYRKPEAGEGGGPKSGDPAWWRPWVRHAAVIAVGALAVGLVVQALPEGPPRLPDRPPSEVRRGIFVETSFPKGELNGVPAELAWVAVPQAVGYEVRLETSDEVVLWRTAALASPVSLPPALRSRLRSQVVYCWKVTALSASGQRIAASRRTPFLIVAGALSEGADQQAQHATERS